MRGTVDAWALTVGCAGGGSQRSPHRLFSESRSSKGLSGVLGRSLALQPPLHMQRSLSLSTGCPHCKKVIPFFTSTADVFKDDRKVRILLFIRVLPPTLPCPQLPHLPPFRSVPFPDRSSETWGSWAPGHSLFIRQARAAEFMLQNQPKGIHWAVAALLWRRG